MGTREEVFGNRAMPKYLVVLALSCISPLTHQWTMRASPRSLHKPGFQGSAGRAAAAAPEQPNSKDSRARGAAGALVGAGGGYSSRHPETPGHRCHLPQAARERGPPVFSQRPCVDTGAALRVSPGSVSSRELSFRTSQRAALRLVQYLLLFRRPQKQPPMP